MMNILYYFTSAKVVGYLLWIILSCCSITTYAQNQFLIDSLKAQLKIHNAAKLEIGKNSPTLYDTVAANILYELSIAYWGNDPDKAMVYAKQVLELSGQIGFKKGMGNAFNSIGTIHAMRGDYSPALESFKNSAKLRDEIGDKPGIASVDNNIGNIFWYQGNYPEALKNYFAALKIREATRDKGGISASYNNIGMIYHTQGNYSEALKNYLASLKIKEEIGNKFDIAGSYNNIGVAYSDQGNYHEALKFFLDALEIREEIGDKYGIASCYDNIGNINDKQVNYPEALKSFFAALKIQEDIGDKQGITHTYGFIGSIYIKQKKYSDASKYLNKKLSLSKEIVSLEGIKESYDGLATSDSGQGNYKQALEHYKLFIATRDSLVNNENTKKIMQQQMQFEFDKKEAASKAEQDKKHAISNAEVQRQKLVRNFSFAGIFVVLLIGGYSFYRYRKNKRIENQQSLLNERLRISRELHDDMGSTLSSISVYSEVAKNRATKNENETEVLQKIGTASRELIEKMSDIVWSLNPNNENFEQLKNRMMAFAAMMLTPKGILFEFDIDDEVKSTAIAPEQRKNIFLIYKEAVNNIVKYSEATSVKVKVKVKENKLSLEVIDNGKGFDANNVVAYNGNGLKNMKARAEEIKALFNVTSRINEGTGIEISFNI